LNELVLNARCVSIRDLQVNEKILIKQKVLDEEARYYHSTHLDKRLDQMMEVDRVKDLARIRIREQDRQKGTHILLNLTSEMKKGAAVLRIQIDERKEAALLDIERKQIETKNTIKAIHLRNEQDVIEKQKKVAKQTALMEQAEIYNKSSLVFKQSKINN